MKDKLTERDLGDIILCDPVTFRGIEALQQLGLQDVVTEDYFFENMYITPKYADEALFSKSDADKNLEHTYSVSKERFDEMRTKLVEFNKKFTSDAKSQSPLLIIGTAGNGKSIEVQYKIRNPKKDNEEIKCNRIIYNLEESFTDLSHEVTFSLSDFLEEEKIDALWLVYMVLLDNLYNLVIKNQKNLRTIAKNHQKCFTANHSADDTEKKLFSYIVKYDSGKSNTVKDLFNAMVELIDKDDASKSIEKLLKMTMNFMYCICPDNKNYIVFDNFEHHIKLGRQKIPIHNEALSKIYRSLIKVTENLTKIYNYIKPEESWRAFKIILVLRRTSEHLLMQQSSAQYPSKHHGMRNDYTGYFDIWHIWEKKKKYIWENHLKAKYDPIQSEAVFWIIDEMMKDKPGVVSGTSYQELICPLMNSGIRRNGRAQAHAAMSVYKILTYNDSYINFDTYKKLLPRPDRESSELQKDPNEVPSAIRYMHRRALLEIQYNWMIISEDSTSRFENLFLGRLLDNEASDSTDRRDIRINKRKVELDYIVNGNFTLVRRILSYLSYFIDEKADKDKTELFQTKPLYNLMTGVLLNPAEKAEEKNLEYYEHYLPLSTVLISLGNMSHSATKCAPLVVLDINDKRFDPSEPEDSFANILKEIWETEVKKGIVNGKYKREKYSVRLTEAGDVFLRDIQPSFSFFAALYCSEEVPLFFLTDPKRIKFVISSVNKEADGLCKKYELAASSFCGSKVSLVSHPSYKYVPKYKGKYITFRNRVMDMHTGHLDLYKDFIEKNAVTLGLTDDKDELMQYIDDIIASYKKWVVDESVKCF